MIDLWSISALLPDRSPSFLQEVLKGARKMAHRTSLEEGSVADRYRHVDKEWNMRRAPEAPGDA